MIIEAKGNKIVGIRNEEVQANTKLYKVVFQPTEKDDIKTIELNTLTATRMEAGEAQQKDYYYMEITHIPTGKVVFTYTDGKVWEYAEEFEMMILKKEEEKTMEKLLTKTQFTEIKEAIQKEVIKYVVEVQQPHPFYILIDISEDMFLEIDYFDQTTSEKNRGNFIVTLHRDSYCEEVIKTKDIQDAFIKVIELVKEYGTEKEGKEMEKTVITNTNYINVDFEKVQPIDIHQVNDIELCMINNSKIAGQIGEINKSIAKKVKAGTFDEHKAIKAYYNRVNAYLETYNTKVYDNYFYNKNMVSVHDRFMVAYNIYFDNMERIEALSKLWSRSELSKYFREYKKQLPQEIKRDTVALKTELCFELDRLNKDGKISDELTNDYIFPKDIVNY